MKLKRKIDEAFADGRCGFWIGFGTVFAVDLLLAALIMYLALVVTPRNRAPYEGPGWSGINPEAPLALLVLVINIVGGMVLPRHRAILRGGRAAIWVALGLTLLSGCGFFAWLFLALFGVIGW